MRMNKIYYMLCCIATLVSCGGNKSISEYDNIPHSGVRDIKVDTIEVDTIKIDASETSLMGRWSMYDDKLYFLDHNLIGVKEYDLDGNYIDTYIRKGNGPNEWITPFVDFCFDIDRNLISIDRNWIINQYDTSYTKTTTPYIFLSDKSYDDEQWNDLLNNPNIEDLHMYSFNLNSRKVLTIGENLLIPVVVEHVAYNGYEVEHSSDFWRESSNFMFINLKNKSTECVFATYPPVYSKSNIPIFSDYSFDKLESEDIIVSYAADSLIYVRNRDGVLKHSFGFDSGVVESDYTQTKTFNEYSEKMKQAKKNHSYFTYLKAVDDYVIRGYKRKGDRGYGFQIYKDENLIGKIETNEEITVLGSHNNYLYATLPADLEGDNFRIIKILIKMNAIS